MGRALHEEKGCTERDIGPWEDRDGGHRLATQMRGKLRIVKLRNPVPPQPMCPETTMINQSFHVLAEEDRILAETSTMSLDVPYGDSFNVVIRDKFTIEGGVIMMERSFGLDWVKSTFMKSMIESNVPANLVKDAERMSALLKKWVSSGGPPETSSTQRVKEMIKRSATASQAASGSRKNAFCNLSRLCCADNRNTSEEISLESMSEKQEALQWKQVDALNRTS